MKPEIKTAIILSIIITVGVSSLYIFYTEIDLKKNTTNEMKVEDKKQLEKSPELHVIKGYINTSEDKFKNLIDGNVVLYDFWTYSCINCIRTLPYITAWDEKYREQGLVIIGIHTPEFEFEKNKENVIEAVKKFSINYPVVLDNDKEIWNEFENNYWPRKYIADHEGYIRFDHIGEGAYKETEKVIQELLQERLQKSGQSISNADVVNIDEYVHSSLRTPELYFGYKFANGRDQLGNSEGFQNNEIVNYQLPGELRKHYFYLDGKWKNNQDGMKLVSNTGKIVLEYHAKQVNIVADGNAELEILIDGNQVSEKIAGSDIELGKIRIVEPRLYNIIETPNGQTHTITINVNNSDFAIFTFTFG